MGRCDGTDQSEAGYRDPALRRKGKECTFGVLGRQSAKMSSPREGGGAEKTRMEVTVPNSGGQEEGPTRRLQKNDQQGGAVSWQPNREGVTRFLACTAGRRTGRPCQRTPVRGQ